MDLVTDIIRLMRPQSVLWRTSEWQGRWGISAPKRDEPVFVLVVEGHCWFMPSKGPALFMQQGDCVMMNATSRYCVASDVDVVPTLSALEVNAGERDYVRWTDGNDGERVRLIGFYFRVDPEHAALLSGLLPDLRHIRSFDEEASRLARLFELIGDEANCELPGRELAMGRLVELMLIEVLRYVMQHFDEQGTGWLSGMAHPKIAKALQMMHADVANHWTLEMLAEEVGMSRAVFARRFTERVGVAPATYLSNWRIAVAKDALLHSDRSIYDIGLSIGYLSDSAFSTAFHRIVGCSPASYRKGVRKDL